MKNALFVLLVMLANYGYSQVYNPAQHTLTPKSMGLSQSAPTDARSMFYDATTFSYRPYTSTTEVMNYLNTPTKRTGGFDIFITVAGEVKVYWFRGGTNLENLVLKSELDTKAPRVTNKGNGTTTTIISDSVRVKLGGEITENITHIYLPVGMKSDQNTLAQSKNIMISNRSYSQDTANSDVKYWNERGSNTLLNLSRSFDELNNDTAYQQYNGVLRLYNKFQFNRNSTRFRWDNKYIMLQEGGVNSTVHTMLPEDSVRVIYGPFGRTGAAGTFTAGYGDYWGYNVALKPSDANPNYPASALMAQTDLVRNIDNTFAKKMSGRITNYLSGWKLYQASISAGTVETGNRVNYISDFTSYGSWYPYLGSSVTKEKVVAVSRVDTAIGMHLLPKRDPYGNPNEVINGGGIYQQGENDANGFEGWTRFGGTLPVRSSLNADPLRYNTEFAKKVGVFDSLVTYARVRHTVTDTSGAGNVKSGQVLNNERNSYFLDQNHTQSNSFNTVRTLGNWYVRDTLRVNTFSNGVSAMPVNESRLVIRTVPGGVSGRPVITTLSDSKYPSSVVNSYLMLGASTPNKKLNGWWANYTAGLDIYNSQDTIENFVNYSTNNGNINNGRVNTSFGLYHNTNPMASVDYGIYQTGLNTINYLEGLSLYKRLVSDTLRMTSMVPNTDSSTILVSTGHLKRVLSEFGGGLPDQTIDFVDSLYSGLISDSTYQKLITGATGNYDSVYTYIKAYPATTWDSVFSFRVPKYNPGGTGITALTGDVTASGTGSVAATIAPGAVTYAKMQNVSTNNRILGRITSGAGVVEELTGTQLTTLIDNFSSSLKGAVPASGGGTTNFLRADGTWAVPPGTGGGVSDGNKGDITVSSSGTNWQLNSGSVGNTEISDVSPTKLTGGSEGQVVKYLLGSKTWAYEDYDMAAALSDETTTITTGTKLTFRTTSQLLIRDVRASLTTASSSGTVSITITVNGSPMFSTPLTIDASEKSSVTAATPFVFSGGLSNFGADNDYEIVVTVSGAGTGAAGLKLYMKGYKMSN